MATTELIRSHTSDDLRPGGCAVLSERERLRGRQRAPLYEQTAKALKETILSGQFGDVLPSHEKLSEALQVSRPTIREAIRLLERGGFVRSIQGIGTVVQRDTPLFTPGLEELVSTTELISRAGYNPGTVFEEVRRTVATLSNYPVFAGRSVLVVERVRSADEVPFVFSVDVIPDPGGDLDSVRAAVAQGSLMVWLQERGAEVNYATTTISAQTADNVLAERLHVPPGSALLYMEETGYDIKHHPSYYSNDYYRTDLTKFRVVRRRSVG